MNFARALILIIVSFITPFFAKACPATTELGQYEHVQLKVYFDTTNPLLSEAFVSALNFWSMYVSMDWEVANASTCNLTLSEGDLTKQNAYAATNRSNGGEETTIVFDNGTTNTERVNYVIAVHELGHTFGLWNHSKSRQSILTDGTDNFRMKDGMFLTRKDLKELAKYHRLRMNLTVGRAATSESD